MQVSNQDAIFEYDTNDCSISSAYFNHDGSRIVATLTDFFPVYYDTQVAQPLAILGASKYRNCVTMKGATFAGPRDSFVVCGSDNFSLYMWDVAAVEKAAKQRSNSDLTPLVVGATVASTDASSSSPMQRSLNANYTVPQSDPVVAANVAQSIAWPTTSPKVFSALSPVRFRRQCDEPLPLPDSAAVEPSSNGATRRPLTESDQHVTDDAAQTQSKRSKLSIDEEPVEMAVDPTSAVVNSTDQGSSAPPSPPAGSPPHLVDDESDEDDCGDAQSDAESDEHPNQPDSPLPILCVPCAVHIGHRSIPNHAIYHPNLYRLYSCGVEKSVRIWSLDAFGPAAEEKAKDWVELRPRGLSCFHIAGDFR
jgi:hypothetical protein